MLNKLLFYIKVGIKLLTRDVVNEGDYRKQYNNVAETYEGWLNEMGQFTNQIIKPEYLGQNHKLSILDFACGTGYITKALMERDIECQITAVDYSENMLAQWRNTVDHRVTIVHAPGIEFLTNTENRYDLILFGWALSYFNHKQLFPLFNRVLKDGGMVGIITNIEGTLAKMEDIFLKVMGENQEQIVKPMDITTNLPRGKQGLVHWFQGYGFQSLEVEEGEVVFSFSTPEQLLEWLEKTGALAGTAEIFKNYEAIREKIIKEIREQKYNDGQYEINHKFAYGVFTKS